ncbi:serine/threonine protein kinase [Pelomyxa schiedti]|nr:serine/threonine protein kinase [Pelomyxa schiedti]
MYTAYGLVGFPLSLIKGFRQIEKDLKVIGTDIDKNKSEVRAIHAKYLGGRTMSVEDEERLKLLKRQEEIMQNETWKIKHSSRCWSFIRLLNRYSFVFGIFFFLVSVLIMVSIIISQINSILYSPCGIGCGFMLSHPDIPNPVDGLLVLLSPYFPLDYAIYIPLVAYLVACTIYSVQLFGIRLICIPIGVLESHKTLPQALLSLCLVTILAMLGLNLQLPLLAPQYVLFGPQEWTNYNNTSVSCSFEAPVSSCVLSEMGKFITGVQLDLNIFAHALFWVTWLFVFLWFCAVMHVLVQRKRAHDQSMRDAVESPVLLETTTKV